ncbi:MAG: lysophospholipid acyltransferase family protein [Blastochloris sp.]|nr:lysophospholipid acyltransferase family protein [Blastochloris sp.]
MTSHVSQRTYCASWFSFLSALARYLPRPLIHWVAVLFGYFYGFTHPEKASVIRKNFLLLATSHPPSPGKIYAEFARVLADYFYLASRPASAAISLVDERHGFANLQPPLRGEHGALLLMPHLSFFEIGGVIMQDLGHPMVALTKAEPSPELTTWRANYRLRWGIETIEVGQDQFQFLQIVKLLEAGRFVGALFDRPHPTQSYAAQVPGGTLHCSSGILLLALLSKCPIIPVTVIRKSNNLYRLDALSPIFVEKKGTTAETLQFYTQHLVDVLWPTINQYPEQWFQFASLEVKS